MRRRRQGVGPFGNHPGFGNFERYLFAGQLPADTGLGSLADLNFHSYTGIEVIAMDRKAARGHLNDEMLLIRIKVGMKPAFAGSHKDSSLPGSISHGAVSI